MARPAGLVSKGYEGRDLEGFVKEPSTNRSNVVADTRLTPLSRKPGVSKTRLGARLNLAGKRGALPSLSGIRPYFSSTRGSVRFVISLRDGLGPRW